MGGGRAEMSYTLDDLLTLMQRLRDPEDGCPWDLQQSYTTIAPHTIEETYELVDAIEVGDMQQVKEELGDVLFQVIFYAQLASEEGRFSFPDLVDTLVSKLLRRHPHVFPDGTLHSRARTQQTETAEVKRNWERIKAEERSEKQRHRVLDDIPSALPAMSRAFKLQKRASQVGFDWHRPEEVIAHLHSELLELNQAKVAGQQEQVEAEFGDLLFCLVNLARHWKLDPEKCLRATNRKFEDRFGYIESTLEASGNSVEEASLQQMDALWEAAKESGL